MATFWREALGPNRTPSADQERAILAAATGRQSVDAGAGTGKTTTLALRALYLIESGSLRAEQIVVVTFTKKAAAEIGGRIADTLDRAIAHDASLAARGRDVRCMTIHALAADILREFALDFGFGTAPRAITDGEAYGIFHAAFRALVNRELAPDTSAFPIAEMNRDALERDLGKLALRLKNHGISPRDFETRALAEAERFGGQSWGQLWSPGKSPGSRIKLNPKDSVPSAEIAREAERERANIRVVAALFAEFDRRLHECGAATYGDLIGVTTRLLREHQAIVRGLRERWRYVLLDESQDTSNLQLALIETLFGAVADADAAGMMPVGDRRQAIYRFNGADEDVMARITAAADATHPLVMNRRSPQEIVDAGHAVLARAGIVDATTPRLDAAAGPATLACLRVEQIGAENGATKEHVAAEAAAIAREIERLLADQERPTLPNEIALLLRRRTHAAAYVRALNERGIAAALDRRSGLFRAPEIRDALAWLALLVDITNRQAAVRILQSPLCGLSDASMIALAAAKDWLERFLRDELAGALDRDGSERVARVRGLLVALLPCVSLPLPVALAQILRELPIVASYVRLGATIGAQAIVNLRSFLELGDAFASENPHARLTDFVADVERRILYDDEPPEAELAIDGVRVMTIHQAKGLEWPYVFVACATKAQYGTAGPSDAIVAYDLASGAFALKNDRDGRETLRWICLSRDHDAATGERLEPQPRKLAIEREQARVFYVALTRAQRRVYITAPVPSGGTGHAPYLTAIREWAEAMEPGVDLCFDAPPRENLESHAPRVASQTSIVAQPSIAQTSIALDARTDGYRPRVSFTSISAFATCPRMARLRYRLRLPDLRERQPRYVGLDGADTKFENAARLGSFAHRILELWGRARIAGTALTIERACELARDDFSDLSSGEVDDARERAARASELLAAYEILAVEEPFALAIGATPIEGAIDLIARAPDGNVYVVDYKTGRTPDEHYALQLALYRHAAMLRYPNETIAGAILRITPTTAKLSRGPDLSIEQLASAIGEVGSLESDVAKIGPWCDFCAYDGAPCRARWESSTASVIAG